MKSIKKKLLLYIPTTALGIGAMVMQSRILSSGFDGKGLLVLDNPILAVLWGMTAAFLIAALAMLPWLGANGTYEENFPQCALSGSVMIAAGLLMGFSGLNGLVPGEMVRGACAIGAGVMMAVCGAFRLAGKKPVFVPDLLIGLYYAAHLLWSYSGWNADPQLQSYAFQLLAGAAAMLFTVHRARCAAGMMDRRSMVFTGFAGIFFSFAAIPGADSATFYLASGLWCAGAMGDLSRLEAPAAPEDPKQTEETEE